MSEEATNSEGLAPEDETSLPESAEPETQETAEDTETEESEAEDRPRKSTAKDRIGELTRIRREAERERDYWRNVALQSQPAPQAASQTQAEAAPPSPDAYEAGEYDSRYIKDVARWEAKQEVAQTISALSAQSSAQAAIAQFQARSERAAETLPDYEEKVILGAQRGEWPCTPIMAEVIRSSEKGPEVAYHLASNPTEAARISRLSPVLQSAEIGKLEAKLAVPKAKTATTAPSATPQVRGSGGKFATPPDTNDFAAFDKQYGNPT